MSPRALGVASMFVALSIAKVASATCHGRPTDASGFQGYTYGTAEVKSFATAQVRVHYAVSGEHAPASATTRADGVPDTVALAADIGEDALAKYAEMGFRKIPGDTSCPSNGGDDKVDIYLVKFAGADGSTIPECVGGVCSSFALVESTFSSKGYATVEEGFRTVVSHELFHAIQNVYREAHDPYWAEGTAQWAMKQLHPDLKDFDNQLAAFFAETSRSIDAPPSGATAGFLYGSAVWPLFLSQRYGTDAIREIFEAETKGSETTLSIIDEVLSSKGSSLADAYPLFAAFNAGTGKLPSANGYADAAKYPGIKIGALSDGVSAITSGLGYYAYRGTLTTPLEISLDTDPARNQGMVVPIEAGTLALDKARKLPSTAEGEVLVVVSGVTSKKTDAPFTLSLKDPPPVATSATPATSDGCQFSPRHQSPPLSLLLVAALTLLARVRSARGGRGSEERATRPFPRARAGRPRRPRERGTSDSAVPAGASESPKPEGRRRR